MDMQVTVFKVTVSCQVSGTETVERVCLSDPGPAKIDACDAIERHQRCDHLSLTRRLIS